MCRFYEVPAREESRRYLVLHSGSGLPDGAELLDVHEVPAREESRRYLVLHSGSGLPGGEELLDPFSRAFEMVRVDA